jgi:hypothetical protein
VHFVFCCFFAGWCYGSCVSFKQDSSCASFPDQCVTSVPCSVGNPPNGVAGSCASWSSGSCSVTCNPGWTVAGTSYTCSAGTLSGGPQSCMKDCSQPQPPRGVSARNCNNNVAGNGGSCTFTLLSNYLLLVGSSLTVTCWDGNLSPLPVLVSQSNSYQVHVRVPDNIEMTVKQFP